MGNLWNVGFEAAFKAELLVDPWDANTEVLGRYLSKLQDGYVFSKMSMVSRPTYWQGLSLANISLDISRNHSGISTYRQNDTDRATPCRPLPRLPFKPSRLSSKYAGNKKDNLSRGWRIQDAMEHIAVQQRSTKCLHLQKWLELCCCSTDILSGHIGSSQAPMLA